MFKTITYTTIRLLAIAAASCATAAGAAIVDPMPGFTIEQTCAAWSRSAMLAGAQALRGKPRVLVPVTLETLKALIAHGQEVPGVAILKSEYDEFPKYFETALAAGFDYVERVQREGHAIPSPQEATAALYEQCMADETVLR